jgi:hypothetical protein
MTFHPETPYWRGIVFSRSFLLGVESYTLADMLVAGGTPYVEGEFEADYQDSLADFMCAATEGVRSCHLVDIGFSIIIWRVVFVEGLHDERRILRPLYMYLLEGAVVSVKSS